MEKHMRKTNNGAPPTLVQQGRSLRTTYGQWALDDAAAEVMDDGAELSVPVPRELAETVSEERAAEILGMTLRSLRDRRRRGTGPAVTYYLGSPRYRPEDLGKWAEWTARPRLKDGRRIVRLV